MAIVAIALAALGLGTIRLTGRGPAGPLLPLCGGVAVLLGVLLGLVTIGAQILGPLDAAARHRRRPTQFTMADFLALIFLLQLPAALIRLVVPGSAEALGWISAFAWIASSLMWGFSVQTLSRAGITTPWRRVVFLSAVLPIAYFGSVVFVATAIFAFDEALFGNNARQITGFFWCLFIDAVLFGAFYWAASFVRTTVARSQRDESDQEATDTVEAPINPLD